MAIRSAGQQTGRKAQRPVPVMFTCLSKRGLVRVIELKAHLCALSAADWKLKRCNALPRCLAYLAGRREAAITAAILESRCWTTPTPCCCCCCCCCCWNSANDQRLLRVFQKFHAQVRPLLVQTRTLIHLTPNVVLFKL